MKNKKINKTIDWIIPIVLYILGMTIISIILFSCASKDPEPLRVQSSRLDGSWSFISPSSKGEFTIKDSVITSGSYTVNSSSFTITLPQKIDKYQFVLWANSKEYLLLFNYTQVKDKVVCQGLAYNISPNINKTINELVILTKQ